MTDQEINDLFEELESVMVRKFPPDKYGEDPDLAVIYEIAQDLLEEAIRRGKQFI